MVCALSFKFWLHGFVLFLNCLKFMSEACLFLKLFELMFFPKNTFNALKLTKSFYVEIFVKTVCLEWRDF